MKRSVNQALTLMTSCGDKWYKLQRCGSCHHQAAPFLAYRMAQERGLPLSGASLKAQGKKTFAPYDDKGSMDGSVQGFTIIDSGLTEGMFLQAAHAAGVKPSVWMAAELRFDAYRQAKDGSWITIDMRPPQTGSLVASTALEAHALDLYLAPYLPKMAAERVDRARRWLEHCPVTDVEDLSYRLLGLRWTGSSHLSIRKAEHALLAVQRADGGWAQIPTRESDAYATGLALVALHEGGDLSVGSGSYRRGMGYLLSTQHADGSWEVFSRIHPPAPVSPTYFQSGFPYGHNQWVSMTGTAWASMALMESLPKTDSQVEAFCQDKPRETVQPWMATVIFGKVTELKKLLDSGFDPNSHTPDGTTALMMAVPEIEKVKLLLDRGANPNSVAKTGYTALMVAANSGEALESTRLLIGRGAKTTLEKPGIFGSTPFLLACASGDVEKASLLAPSKKDIDKKVNLASIFNLSALGLAVYNHNDKLARYLAKSGADLEAKDEQGLTVLDYAVLSGDTSMATTLVEMGAKVNYRDPFGMTPLLWACTIDRGSPELVKCLVAHGAERTTRTKEGLTAWELSKKNGIVAAHEALSNLR